MEPAQPNIAKLMISLAILEDDAELRHLKRNQPLEVATAIRDFGNGGSLMSSSIARKGVGTFRQPDSEDCEPLSRREAELLDLPARSRTYKECATGLEVSVDTVRTHIRHIYIRL